MVRRDDNQNGESTLFTYEHYTHENYYHTSSLSESLIKTVCLTTTLHVF